MAVLEPWRIPIEERESYLRMAAKVRQNGDDIVIPEDSGSDGEESQVIQISQERFQELSDKEQFILTITENGFGKRSSAYEYRTTQRGSQGFTNITVNQRNGQVVGSFPVEKDDQIILVTNQGRLIRCPVHDIRITGRRALGVIIFRVDKGEQVVAVRRISSEYLDEDLSLPQPDESVS
jgi:DNA gyrase subunit A